MGLEIHKNSEFYNNCNNKQFFWTVIVNVID